MSRKLVERGVFVVELDLGHLEGPGPLGLVPQTISSRGERASSSVMKSWIGFRVVKLGGRDILTHRAGPVFG